MSNTANTLAILGAGIAGRTLARCLSHHRIPFFIYDRERPSLIPPELEAGKAKHISQRDEDVNPLQLDLSPITLQRNAYGPLCHLLGVQPEAFRNRFGLQGHTKLPGAIDPCRLIDTGSSQPEDIRIETQVFRDFLYKEAHEENYGTWRFGADVEAVTVTNGPVLHLSSGESISHAAIISADGLNIDKTLRNIIGRIPPLRVLPWVVYTGMHTVDNDEFRLNYSLAFGESTMIQTRSGEAVLHLNIHERTENQTKIRWIYSRQSGPNDPPLRRSLDTIHLATEAISRFYDEIDALSDLGQPFADIFNVEKLRSDAEDGDRRVKSWLMASRVLSPDILQTLQHLGLYFLGDAAHLHPIVGGTGASTAIVDAVTLAQHISDHGITDMTRWYKESYRSWVDGVKQAEEVLEDMHQSEHVAPSLDPSQWDQWFQGQPTASHDIGGKSQPHQDGLDGQVEPILRAPQIRLVKVKVGDESRIFRPIARVMEEGPIPPPDSLDPLMWDQWLRTPRQTRGAPREKRTPRQPVPAPIRAVKTPDFDENFRPLVRVLEEGPVRPTNRLDKSEWRTWLGIDDKGKELPPVPPVRRVAMRKDVPVLESKEGGSNDPDCSSGTT